MPAIGDSKVDMRAIDRPSSLESHTDLDALATAELVPLFPVQRVTGHAFESQDTVFRSRMHRRSPLVLPGKVLGQDVSHRPFCRNLSVAKEDGALAERLDRVEVVRDEQQRAPL